MEKKKILKDVFGLSDFREGQDEIISHILERSDVLGIMPTGGGKSLCYQLPAQLFPGITLVISPLISLMKDQVASLLQVGIEAAFLNSSLSHFDYSIILEEARQDRYKIIYVAPERLLNEDFIRFAKHATISMITVDEAHCISQWGHNFRTSYLKIPDFIDLLPVRPVISAFTATATELVKKDIIAKLKLHKPFVKVTGFDRKNLSYRVEKPKDKFMATLDFVEKNNTKSGIIYCSTRKTVEDVANRLEKYGIKATRYHAGLSEEERHQNQDDFIYDTKTVMVATNAFGMGIDKSNVSYVVHYNMPKNIESYYQEAGRAGRDGGEAECVLLYSGQDVKMNQFLIEKSTEDDEEVDKKTLKKIREKELELLKKMTFYCFTNDCLRQYVLSYFGESTDNFCGNCSNCENISDDVDVTIEAQKIISCILRADQKYGMTVITQILTGKLNDKLKKANLHQLSTFNIMESVPTKRIESIILLLLVKGYLEQTPGNYSILKVNAKAKNLLKGTDTLSLKVKKSRTQAASRSTGAKKEKDYHLNRALDHNLFESLRELRNRLSKEERVPAYIIFPDTTLKEMARKLPKDYIELERINGVGKVKLQKYGAQFLDVINK